MFHIGDQVIAEGRLGIIERIVGARQDECYLVAFLYGKASGFLWPERKIYFADQLRRAPVAETETSTNKKER